MFYCGGGTRWRSQRSVAFSTGMNWAWEMGELKMFRGHRHLRICRVKWFIWKIAFLRTAVGNISIRPSAPSDQQPPALYHHVLSKNCNKYKFHAPAIYISLVTRNKLGYILRLDINVGKKNTNRNTYALRCCQWVTFFLCFVSVLPSVCLFIPVYLTL
jgi:hypothetical protein